jgi:hypothetical protein
MRENIMTIFGDCRLGRISYAIVLVLMVCFDFAKSPVEHFIISMHDVAARELMAPRTTVSDARPAPAETNARSMPLMFKGQEDAVRSIVNSGRKPSPSDMEKLRAATQASIAQAIIDGPDSDPQTKRLAYDRAFFEMLYPIAAIIMTGITVIGLLWMVSSRLRDIGWPQYLLWVLLAPVFLPKFIAIPLSAPAIQGINVFFYGVLLILAFIPTEDTVPKSPTRQPPVPPVTVKRRPGQFGKLGTL